MQSWRRIWRDGIAPQLSTAGLQALCRGLEEDDVRLIQGSTTNPCGLDDPVEAACAIAYCGWKADGLLATGEVKEYFADVFLGTLDRTQRGPESFLKWFDETPREEMRRRLLREVQRILAERAGKEEASEQRA